MMVEKLGEEWMQSWWKGLPGTYETPTGDDPTSAALYRSNAVLLGVDAVPLMLTFDCSVLNPNPRPPCVRVLRDYYLVPGI